MDNNIVKLSVYGILTDKENKVLLQKRSNTTFANGWWSFPGGHVESNESIEKALCRELFEEAGIKIALEHCAFQLTLVRKPQAGKRYINFFYVIKSWYGIPTISDAKASELSFFSLDSLPNPTLPYIQEAISLIEKRVQFYESIY